jgi:anti-sigma factor RsiW
MCTSDDRKITAYLDHELPLEEAAALEKTLSNDALEKLQGEMPLESALAKRLNAPECPDVLWKKLRRQMNPGNRSVTFRFPRRTTWLWLPLAASLAVVAGLYLNLNRQTPPFIEQVSTVAALRAETKQESPSDALAESGFSLSVAAIPAEGDHDIKLLGGYTTTLAGEPVAVIGISCCNEPLRILVTRRGSRAAEALLHGNMHKNMQIVTWRGKYQLAVVGTHPAAEALSLF